MESANEASTAVNQMRASMDQVFSDIEIRRSSDPDLDSNIEVELAEVDGYSPFDSSSGAAETALALGASIALSAAFVF